MRPQDSQLNSPVTGAQPGAHTLRSARGADRMKPGDMPIAIGFIIPDVIECIDARIEHARESRDTGHIR
jgi:hypothetical protein